MLQRVMRVRVLCYRASRLAVYGQKRSVGLANRRPAVFYFLFFFHELVVRCDRVSRIPQSDVYVCIILYSVLLQPDMRFIISSSPVLPDHNICVQHYCYNLVYTYFTKTYISRPHLCGGVSNSG